MIRATIMFCMLSSSVLADGDEDYLTERDAAFSEFVHERQQFRSLIFHLPDSVDSVLLEETGQVFVPPIYGPDSPIYPELVAIFDHTTGRCSWSFNTQDFPHLPRAAAWRVQAAARARGWPTEATAPILASSIPDCLARSMLATTIGDLALVYPVNLDSRTIYLGLRTAEGSS